MDYRNDGICPVVYDQGKRGTCTGQAAGGAVHIKEKHANYPWQYTPSRLFIYYNTRSIEGNVWIDSGATISGTIKAMNKFGVCPEDSNPKWSWPYKDDAFTFRTKPKAECYKQAVLHRALEYQSVLLDRVDIMDAVADYNPVIIGVAVYESFERTGRDGIVAMPNPKIERMLGGHAMLIVGYDERKDMAIVRNSWGAKWGDSGYCYMPFDYLCNGDLAADFAVIELVGYGKQ